MGVIYGSCHRLASIPWNLVVPQIAHSHATSQLTLISVLNDLKLQPEIALICLHLERARKGERGREMEGEEI